MKWQLQPTKEMTGASDFFGVESMELSSVVPVYNSMHL
jgi:hypothetical protein